MIKFIKSEHEGPVYNYGSGAIAENLTVMISKDLEYDVYKSEDELYVKLTSTFAFFGVATRSPYLTSGYAVYNLAESPYTQDEIRGMLEDYETRLNEMLSENELACHVLPSSFPVRLKGVSSGIDLFATEILKTLEDFR